MSDSGALPSYVRSPGVAFLSSLSVDRPLARCDLAGSVAHVQMLQHVGLVSAEEARTLVRGLQVIGREIADGTFPWHIELEDVHTNIESRLTEMVGPVGGKLHTGRSRNDQIALDERLFLRTAVADVAHRLLAFQGALIDRSRPESATPMPGYTHLQRAQPVSVGHWLLAHYWKFDRDLDRLVATTERANVSPLGAGALAGSTLPIDPAFVADRLGFARPFENSMDAVSDRDYFAEFVFDLSLLAVHLSALAEEIVLFASKEFGFLERTDALGSGSSLMPQKRNPDVAELVRGKAGRVIGDLTALLTTLKGLPLTYDRDLQEDKGPVLDAAATVGASLDAMTTLLPRLVFGKARLAEASSDLELYATDLAEGLVSQGVPFRTAHETVGAIYSAQGGPTESAVRSALGPAGSVAPLTLAPQSALERRTTAGGPAPASVANQIRSAETRRNARLLSLSSLDRQVGLIEELLNEEPK